MKSYLPLEYVDWILNAISEQVDFGAIVSGSNFLPGLALVIISILFCIIWFVGSIAPSQQSTQRTNTHTDRSREYFARRAMMLLMIVILLFASLDERIILASIDFEFRLGEL